MKQQSTKELPLQFNMGLTSKRYQTVVVGNLGSHGCKLVTTIDVPLLVNITKLDPCDQLYMAMPEKPKPSKRPTNWKDAVKAFAHKKAKFAAAPKPPAAPSMFVEVEAL